MSGRSRSNGEGSIFPYRNGYAGYVWVRTPTGKRKRKYVYGPTREIVHEKWIKLHHRAKQGPVATKVPRLREYLAYWLDEVIKPNRAPLTYVNYELFVRLYINPWIGERRLDRLQVQDVQTWLNKLPHVCQCCAQGKDTRRPPEKRRCCAIGHCCEDTPSARMIGDIRACLRRALNQAITDELITRNVAAHVTLPSTRKRKGKAWTSDEARKFLESAKADSDPLYAAYVLILVLGLRKGEVLGLMWDDVNLDAGELTVGLQLQRVRRELLHRQTKTDASEDTLPLIDVCTAALQARRKTTGRGHPESRAGVAGRWPGVHHPVRHTRRTAQLQPLVGYPHPQGRCAQDHRARRPTHLRHPPGGPGRPPPAGHAHPAPRPVRVDHGGLRPSLLEPDPGRAETTRR
nr:site-specific integrase [Qaidamihabitans albus]